MIVVVLVAGAAIALLPMIFIWRVCWTVAYRRSGGENERLAATIFFAVMLAIISIDMMFYLPMKASHVPDESFWMGAVEAVAIYCLVSIGIMVFGYVMQGIWAVLSTASKSLDVPDGK